MLRLGRKKRKQDCLILTEDGRIVEAALPVEKGYIVDHKTQEAWGLFPGSQVPQRGSNRVFVVLSERDVAPISGNGDSSHKITEKAMSAIAGESADEALAQLEKKSFRNKLGDTIRLVILIFAITIVVMVLFGLITTGKLHLPDFGAIF